MELYKTKPLQHLGELAEFVEFVRQAGAASYLEVGSKFGGSLWAVSRALREKSKIVAVDKPGQWDAESSLKSLIKHLRQEGHDAQVFIGDSTAVNIIEAVQRLGPFDIVLIDANHTEPYVRKDFANYGRLGRHCCFHDIGWNNPTKPGHLPIEVPKVWREIKITHADQAIFHEIKHDKGHNGFGILTWADSL